MAKPPRDKPDFAAVVEAGAPNVAYGEADLQQLAKTLAVDVLAPEIADRLQQAAQAYLFAVLVDRDPSRKEKHKVLQGAAKKLRAIVRGAHAVLADLDKLDAPTSQALKSLGALIGFAEAMEQLAETIPKSGGDPERARHHFVEALRGIYHDARGEVPKRRHDPVRRKDYGPFLDFVCAALTPIDPGALKGIEHVVRAVLALWQNSRPKPV
jgi:hypothetical protein